MDSLPWITAVTQTGALGLAVALIGWAMKVIPERLKQGDQERVADRDERKSDREQRARSAEEDRKTRERVAELDLARLNKLADTFLEVSRQERQQAATLAQYEREQCDQHHRDLLVKMAEQHKDVSESFKEVRHCIANLAQKAGIDAALKEERKRWEDAGKGAPRREDRVS